jgi:outer membrane protein assembly factor BamE (lipoprotein component of BamABCDE complex)
LLFSANGLRWRIVLHNPGTGRREPLGGELEMTMIMRALNAATAIALSVVLYACATQLGRDFDEAWAQQIKPGETTKAQVVERLGRPPMRRAMVDEETWTYAHYKGRGLGLHIFDTWGLSDEDLQRGAYGTQKRLIVTFKGDVVQSSKFTQELPLPYP